MKRAMAVSCCRCACLCSAAVYVPQNQRRRLSRPGSRARSKKRWAARLKSARSGSAFLPTPGLTISDVTIGEDPKIGAEPVAYVKTLLAVPRITALFGGPLEFASVDLEDASLNLTRVGPG